METNEEVCQIPWLEGMQYDGFWQAPKAIDATFSILRREPIQVATIARMGLRAMPGA